MYILRDGYTTSKKNVYSFKQKSIIYLPFVFFEKEIYFCILIVFVYNLKAGKSILCGTIKQCEFQTGNDLEFLPPCIYSILYIFSGTATSCQGYRDRTSDRKLGFALF